MTKKIKEQILEVRDTGLVNMLDINGVQRIANDMHLYDLVVYLIEDEDRKEYSNFIFYGDDAVTFKDEDVSLVPDEDAEGSEYDGD